MDKKEKAVQKALGLFNTYCGYVIVRSSVTAPTYYAVYEVQDVTINGARKQLNKIVKVAQKKSTMPLELSFVAEKTEKIPYVNPPSYSNPKS